MSTENSQMLIRPEKKDSTPDEENLFPIMWQPFSRHSEATRRIVLTRCKGAERKIVWFLS